ncbi:MAG TPA: phosphate-starvation-inducible PsiE family protein [Acidimicrobiia bacterium]|nr:phosphate-starvation-inducible PsiE family protein [Acidimicrobiia bacterium]
MAEQGNEWADRWFGIAEMILYGVVAVILVAGAALVLVDTARTFVEDLGDDVSAAATALLAELLLVFVFVELLGAVRTTLRERQLIAEPFLLVGIIAAIKEIVVVAGAERPADAGFEEFRNSMIEVGVLALVILVLAISALLLRRREREPEEAST